MKTRDREKLYQAAERFVDVALRRDDSLFTPGEPVWSLETLQDLHEKFVGRPDESSDSFETKLRRQLHDAPPRTIQLMGELLYVHFLIPINVKGETKREIIRTVLAWSPRPVSIPVDLAAVLDQGVARTGTMYNTARPFQLFFLVNFAQIWKSLPAAERDAALANPWHFKEIVWRVPLQKAHSQREGLIHLVFPDVFEDIVSQKAKSQIARSLASYVTDPTDDVDRQMAQIRRKLSDQYGPDFSFYNKEVVGLWDTATDRWTPLLAWAKRFFDSEDFDAHERDYKLELVGKIQKAREALLVGGPWLPLLREAFVNSKNNLTSWRTHTIFLEWVEQHPEDAAAALRILWSESATVTDRIRGFLNLVPEDALRGPSARLTLASYLHMAHDPTTYPHYKRRQVRKGCELTGYPPAPREADEAQLYEHALGFLDRLSEEAASRGIDLRDRLDAQGVLWAVVNPPPVSERFSAKDRNALLRYLGEEEEAVDGGREEPEPSSTQTLNHLADALLFPVDYLRRIERLLDDKRQVIFHGPPGTGKTHAALEIARFYSPEDAIELVQFHPSYTYEDFIEGFRPSLDDGGRFVLRQGPLKRLAKKAADHPEIRHFLVIDEINRGNLAKVFGELYFLLEYRDRQVNLQYSDSSFSLPRNLYVLGTMNTADRSIALVDLALRRRFHFIPFFPDEPPIQGLLERWLARHRPDLAWVARAVDHANEILGNRHAAIGPSYFFDRHLDDEKLRLVWEHSVLPYVAEQLFGGDEGRLEEFRLDRLLEWTGPGIP